MKPPPTFTRTVDYFRKNHNTADVHRYKELLSRSVDQEVDPLSISSVDNLLEREVDKYNKLKIQAQVFEFTSFPRGINRK
jgi:hypothetical protein